MLRILLSGLLIVALGTVAESAEMQRVETRYGPVDLSAKTDAVEIRFRGKGVRSIDALGASLHRVTPRNKREFVIVDALAPGLHCHHFFVLLELAADGNVIASNEFGECKELKGVEFINGSLLVRLGDPSIAGRPPSRKTTDFAWKDGRMVQTSGRSSPKSK